jgi:hypothetical protein
VEGTQEALARLRRFAQAMTPGVAHVDVALPALLALLRDVGARFKLVGGVAVVHHGYLRTTEDIDVLVDAASAERLAAGSPTHGFTVESRTRLKHSASGVLVDLLVAGQPMPRPGAPPYPSPDALAASPTDPDFVGLLPLCELKIRAHRHQDLADVVELLQRMEEGPYIELEAAIHPALRPELATLRRDALEEKASTR